MIKNMIRVALRNFKKDKSYSLLNVVGLAIGITFSLFLMFYVMDELSYDRYYKNADRIARIVSYVNEPANAMKWASTQFPLGPTLKRDYPEVEQAVRVLTRGPLLYKHGDHRFYENKIFYADSNLFDVFTYSFIEGDPKTALIAPNSMVLSQTLAEKYYGKAVSALGQSLENSRGDVYKITGVIKDVPKNSHIIFNGIISLSTLPKDYSDTWGQFNNYTYARLRENTSVEEFEKKLLPMYEKHMATIFAQYNIKIKYGVQPVTSIHLHSDFAGEPEELGSMSYIYIFSAVALFMLIIACINYMNLTTARSARRAKEIGIRKVTGSTRPLLIAQFLTESLLITFISLLLSLVLVYLLLPVFNSLAGKSITFQFLLQVRTVMALLGIILFVGLLGGSYPAFYLARFNPVSILKGNLSKGSTNVTLRRVLVVVQFSISMIMIICTWVVYAQLKYMRNKDLGFNKEQVVSMNIDAYNDIRGRVAALKGQIKQNPKVSSVSTAETIPGGDNVSFNLFSIETSRGFVEKGIDCYGIDEDYLQTLGIKLIQGRGFSFSNPSDTLRSALVNEDMVRSFGWDNALGKRIKIPGDTSGNFVEVVGVVKDFHQKSLYNPIAPLILFYRPSSNNIQVKIRPQDIASTLSSIENLWKKTFPELLFQYTFLDQDFNSQYTADQKRGKIFTSFSTLTIIITCLGLLGLIAFTTEQRQKEISIRKVMGAGIQRIVSLIARNFVILVGISCLIAFPVAYYFMHKWLDIFPYKTDLKVTTFLLSALAVLVIALLTVSFHTIKVAISNPVKSLRSE